MSERQPLLKHQLPDERQHVSPKIQIAILCAARMVESSVFFTIFPFIAAMIEDLGVEQSRIGFYSGFVEAAFACTQCIFTFLLWTDLSDKYGRKPVLIISLAGLSISAALFGFSSSIQQMIFFRSVAGIFSGSLTTIRVMISELSTPATEARSFSLFAFTGALAIVLAPISGGFLVDPASRFKLLDVRLFRTYPYLLPPLVSGVFGGVLCLLCAIFVVETKPWDDGRGEQPEPVSRREIFRSPRVVTAFAANLLAYSLGTGHVTVQPIFRYTKISLGGLGLTSEEQAYLTAAHGIAQAVLLLFAFPPLQHRIGTRGVLITSGVWFAAGFLWNPILNVIAARCSTSVFWVSLGIGTLLNSLQNLVFPAMQLYINSVSPSARALGKINSVFIGTVMALRGVLPAGISSLYAFGIEHGILGGHLAWAALEITSIVFIVVVAASRQTSIKEDEETSEGGRA